MAKPPTVAPLWDRPYRARYLSGGGFDGGTDLILWLGDARDAQGPIECDQRLQNVTPCQSLGFEILDIAGTATGSVELVPTELSTRLTVGGDLPASAIAGYVQVANRIFDACQILPTGIITPVQLWVTPVLTATERFSVGLEATLIE